MVVRRRAPGRDGIDGQARRQGSADQRHRAQHGRAAALEFAAQGAAVFGCDLDEKASAETVEMVTASGGRMAALAPVDLAGAEGARAWAGAAVAEFGGVDILDNNASALRNGPLMALSDEDWHFTITNELDIVWFSVRAAWPELVARGDVVTLEVEGLGMVRNRVIDPAPCPPIPQARKGQPRGPRH
jgi:meso-butanediol dehydrogenase/(S,S)-butanediol dehydrogenase/diacetyl reductase